MLSGCLILAGLSNLCTVEARERMGGVNGGGGNFFEALFKTKAIELAANLLELTDGSKKQLGFDPDDLYASLNETGGFFAICAKGKELRQIKNENKMARVFNDKPGKVYLNCSDYSQKDWSAKLDLSNPASAVFILHESLRIMDFAGEDNYGFSKNYLKAKRSEDKFFDEKVRKYVRPSPPSEQKCIIDIDREGEVNSEAVNIFYNGQSVFAHTYNYTFKQGMEETFRSSIFNQSTLAGREAHQDLVSAMKKLECD
jgi:hypothetical protein